MTGRERVLIAVRREAPDRVPVTLAYEWIDDLCRRRGHPEFAGRLKQDAFCVGFRDAGKDNRTLFKPWLGDCPPNVQVSDFGVATLWSSTGASHQYIHPLAKMESAKELDAYPFPDMSDPARHAHLEAEIQHVVSLLRPTDAVLELGCGYGRFACANACAHVFCTSSSTNETNCTWRSSSGPCDTGREAVVAAGEPTFATPSSEKKLRLKSRESTSTTMNPPIPRCGPRIWNPEPPPSSRSSSTSSLRPPGVHRIVVLPETH
jgi:hypothetical protein